MAVVRRAAIKLKRELVLVYYYFSFIAVVRRPTINKRAYNKTKVFLVLFWFYFSFIAVVRAA